MNQHAQVLRELLGKKAIAFQPIFAKALGSIPAAVMLSQGYFWQETAKYKELATIDGEDYFTATSSEWYEETAVSIEQQMKARDIMRKAGFWIEKKQGIPARLFYRIDFERLVLFIAEYLETQKQVLGKTQNNDLVNPKTVHGENPKQGMGFPQNYIIEEDSLFESLDSSIVADAPTEDQTVFSIEIFEPSKTETLTLKAEKKKNKKAPAPRRAKLQTPGAGDDYLRTIGQAPDLQPYQAKPKGDAVELAMEWIVYNTEQVVLWQDRAGQRFDSRQLKEEVVKFFSHYQGKYGPDHMANTRPLYFFQKSFGGWLMNAKQFNTPKPGKQTLNDTRGISYAPPEEQLF